MAAWSVGELSRKECTALNFPNVSPEKGSVVVYVCLDWLSWRTLTQVWWCQVSQLAATYLTSYTSLGTVRPDPNKIYAAGFLFGKYNLEGSWVCCNAWSRGNSIITSMLIFCALTFEINPWCKVASLHCHFWKYNKQNPSIHPSIHQSINILDKTIC